MTEITETMTPAEVDAILAERRVARAITFTPAMMAEARAMERAYSRRPVVKLTMENQDLVLGGYEF